MAAADAAEVIKRILCTVEADGAQGQVAVSSKYTSDAMCTSACQAQPTKVLTFLACLVVQEDKIRCVASLSKGHNSMASAMSGPR